MRTAAVCVGIDAYIDPTVPRLRFAGGDAVRFARLLRSLGVKSDDVSLLIDAAATRNEVLRVLRVILASCDPPVDRFIFFFAGHGANPRTRTKSASSVLLPADCKREDIEGTGITFADLVLALNRLKPAGIFLFIDACQFDVSDTSGLVLLGDHERGLMDVIKPVSILCLASAPTMEARETAGLQSGVFTHHLTRIIRNIHSSSSPSPASLVDAMEENWREHPSLQPFARYLYAVAPLWLVGVDTAASIPGPRLPRMEARQIIQKLLLKEGHTGLWIHGESGSGKTQLFLDIKRQFRSAIYASAESHSESANLLEDTIREAAVTQLGLERAGMRVTDLKSALASAASLYDSPILIIDHAERVSAMVLDRISDISRECGVRPVVVGQFPPLSSIGWEAHLIPKLSLEEATSLIALFGVDMSPEELLVRSRHNMARALNTVSKGGGPVMSPLLLQPAQDGVFAHARAARALVLATGCCDVQLFAQHFSVGASSLEVLETSGLAYRLHGELVPHDQLVEWIDSTGQSLWRAEDINEAVFYWCAEMSLFANLIKAIHLSNAVIRAQEYCEEADRWLANAIYVLYQERQWTHLRIISEWIKRQENGIWEKALLACLYIESERADFSGSRHTIQALSHRTLSVEAHVERLICEARAAWWQGNYSETKSLAQAALKLSPSANRRERICLEVGIAWFFEGQWELARRCFDQVSTEDRRTYAWAEMMLGSIDGIRGIDLENSERLMLSAAELLEICGDSVGLGINWNNLGEMRWKGQNYVGALQSLQLAEEVAQHGGNETDQMEVCRNQLATSMRLYGPKSAEASHYHQKMISMDIVAVGAMQQMQVWNTLATYYAYRGDSDELRRSVECAATLTTGNPEYDIYTFGNQALLALLENRFVDATEWVKKGVLLAAGGGNLFAVHQLHQDVYYVAKNCTGDQHGDFLRS